MPTSPTPSAEGLETLAAHGVTVHGDSQVAAYGDVIPAEERDFAEEYLSLDIAVAIMDSLDAALQHIRRYSTGHSETIITESQTSVLDSPGKSMPLRCSSTRQAGSSMEVNSGLGRRSGSPLRSCTLAAQWVCQR